MSATIVEGGPRPRTLGTASPSTPILNRATDPSSAAVTPAGTTPLAGVDLPDDYDPSRQYVIPGCTVPPTEDRYQFPEGPPSPFSRTLADVVREVAG